MHAQNESGLTLSPFSEKNKSPEGPPPMPPPDSNKVEKGITPYNFMLYGDNLDTFHVAIDTFLHGTHIYNPMLRQSISNTTLGNMGSPYISNLYFERPEVEFLFSDVYDAYYKNHRTIPYVNTKTPFTILSYSNGGPKKYAEESISILFSQNINKELNIGFYYDLIYGRGRYDSQSTRHRNYGGFLSYNGVRYNAYFNIGASLMENYENGGFGSSTAWDDSNILDPSDEMGGQPQNFSTRISDASSFLKNRFICLNQKYNIGVMRDVVKEDSVETEFVSALNITHQFKYDKNIKEYQDDDAVKSYYDTAYINSSSSKDYARIKRISNRLGLYLDEGINRYGKFGAGAYIQMDNNYISNNPWRSIEDSSFQKGYSDMLADDDDYVMDSLRLDFAYAYDGDSYTNVIFGGSLFKREGTHFFYDASGQICLSGHNAGDWQVKGEIREVFPRLGKMEISGRANFSRKTANYFLQHYYANNFWWDNSFNATFSQQLGGTLDIPAINLKLSLDVDNRQNVIYFDEQALPQQSSDNLAVMAFRVEKDFELGKHWVWENDVVYQETSSERVSPLPQLTVYTNFYHRNVYAKVLHFEIGVDCRYHTSYNAPGYMPATGRFYNQRELEIGNYPLINVYADFFLRRMRFFVMGQHINMGWPTNEFFSAPHYAYNPRMFKMGLQWTFYD